MRRIGRRKLNCLCAQCTNVPMNSWCSLISCRMEFRLHGGKEQSVSTKRLEQNQSNTRRQRRPRDRHFNTNLDLHPEMGVKNEWCLAGCQVRFAHHFHLRTLHDFFPGKRRALLRAADIIRVSPTNGCGEASRQMTLTSSEGRHLAVELNMFMKLCGRVSYCERKKRLFESFA